MKYDIRKNIVHDPGCCLDQQNLAVDDDPIVAESIAEYLAGVGYDTAAATSGEEALQALQDAEQKVELLLKKNDREEVVPFDSETG